MDKKTTDVTVTDNSLIAVKRRLIDAIYRLIEATEAANNAHAERKNILDQISIIDTIIKSKSLAQYLRDNAGGISANLHNVTVDRTSKEADESISVNSPEETILVLNRSEVYSINDLNGDIDFTENEFSPLKKSTKEVPAESGTFAHVKVRDGWASDFYKNKPKDSEYWFIRFAVAGDKLSKDKATTPQALNTLLAKGVKVPEPGTLSLRITDNGSPTWKNTPEAKVIPGSATSTIAGLVQFTEKQGQKVNLIISPKFIVGKIKELNKWSDALKDDSRTYVVGFDATKTVMEWSEFKNVHTELSNKNATGSVKSYVRLTDDAKDIDQDTQAITPKSIGDFRKGDDITQPYIQGYHRGLAVTLGMPSSIDKHGLTITRGGYKDSKDLATKHERFAEESETDHEALAIQASAIKDKTIEEGLLKEGDPSKVYAVGADNKLKEITGNPILTKAQGYASEKYYTSFKKFLKFLKSKVPLINRKERIHVDAAKAVVKKKQSQFKVIDKNNYASAAKDSLSYDGSATKETVVTTITPAQRTAAGKLFYTVAKNNSLKDNKTTDIEIEYESSKTQVINKNSTIALSNNDTAAIATRIKSDIFNYDTLYIKNLDNKTTITNQDVAETEVYKIATGLTNVYSCKISPSGKFIIILHQNNIEIYSIKDKKLLFDFKYTGKRKATKISFSYNEKTIAIGTNREEIYLITTEDHIQFETSTIKSPLALLEGLEKSDLLVYDYMLDVSNQVIAKYSGVTLTKLQENSLANDYLLFGAEVAFIPNRNQFITTIPATRSIQVFTYLEASKSYELTQTVNEIDVINADGIIETQEDTYMNIAISPCVSYLICGTATQETICLYKLKEGNEPIVVVPMQKIKVYAGDKIQTMFSTTDTVLYLQSIDLGFTTRYERKLNLFEAGSTIAIAANAEIIFDSLKEEIKAYNPIHDNNFNERLVAKWTGNTVTIYSKASANEKYHIQKIISFKKETTTTIDLTDKCGYLLRKKDGDEVLYKLKPEARQKKNNSMSDAFNEIVIFKGTDGGGVFSLDNTKVDIKFASQTNQITTFNLADPNTNTTKTGTLTNTRPNSKNITVAGKVLSIDGQVTHITDVDKFVVDGAGTTIAVFTTDDITLYSILPLHDAQIPTTLTSGTGNLDIKKLDISENNVIALYSLHDESKIAITPHTIKYAGGKVVITAGIEQVLEAKGNHATITAYRKSQGSYYKFHHETAITTLKEEPYLKLSKDGNYIQFSLNNNVIKTVDARDGSTVSKINTKNKITNSLKQKITATDDLMSVFFIEDDIYLYAGSATTGTKLRLQTFTKDAKCCIACSNDGLFVYVGLPTARKVIIYDILKDKPKEIHVATIPGFGKSIYYSNNNYIIVGSDAGATVVIDTLEGYKHLTNDYNAAFLDFKVKELLSTPNKTYAYLYSINKQADVIQDGEFNYTTLDDIEHGANVQIINKTNKKNLTTFESSKESKDIKPTLANSNIFYRYYSQFRIPERKPILEKYPLSTKTSFTEKEQKALISSENADGNLGYSVAMSNNFFFLGDPKKRAVYLYTKSDANWNKVKTLTGGASFGKAIACTEKQLIVGEPDNSKAEIWERSGANWNKVKTLTGGASFGASVSNSNQYITIGEPQATKAVVYVSNGDFLVTPTGRTSFGEMLASNSKYIAIAEPKNNKVIIGSFFDRTCWFKIPQTKYDGLPDNTQGYTGYHIKGGKYELVRPVGTTDTYTKYKGGAWIKNGNWGGVLFYDGAKIGFEKVVANTGRIAITGSTSVNGGFGFMDASGQSWVGTYSSGIGRLDTNTGKITITDTTNMERGFGFVDASGQAWVGTYNNGIGRLNTNTGRITITDGTDVLEGFGFVDASGQSWVGTYGKGIGRLNANTGRISITDSTDVGVGFGFVDASGQSWVGTFKVGIGRFNTNTGRISITDRTAMANGFGFVDASRQSWVGTFSSGIGRFNTNTGKITITDSAKVDFGFGFLDTLGQSWVGTKSKGIGRFNTTTGRITITGSTNVQNGFGFLDASGQSWVGTTSAGIGRLDTKDTKNQLYLETSDGKHYYNNKEVKDATNFDSVMQDVAPLPTLPDTIPQANRNLKLTKTDMQEQPNKTGNYVSLLGTGTATTAVSSIIDVNKTEYPKPNDSISMNEKELLIASKADKKAYVYDITTDPLTTTPTKAIDIQASYGDSCTIGDNHFTVGSVKKSKVKLFNSAGVEVTTFEGNNTLGFSQAGYNKHLLIGSETANYAELHDLTKPPLIDKQIADLKDAKTKITAELLSITNPLRKAKFQNTLKEIDGLIVIHEKRKATVLNYTT